MGLLKWMQNKLRDSHIYHSYREHAEEQFLRIATNPRLKLNRLVRESELAIFIRFFDSSFIAMKDKLLYFAKKQGNNFTELSISELKGIIEDVEYREKEFSKDFPVMLGKFIGSFSAFLSYGIVSPYFDERLASSKILDLVARAMAIFKKHGIWFSEFSKSLIWAKSRKQPKSHNRLYLELCDNLQSLMSR